ncbi:MAG: hypothetical protein V2I57_05435 [Xanthomonadales bacterium]|jgi:hypothetical protein|nr:hypothetical protein [Xanthomonadales bacterium]
MIKPPRRIDIRAFGVKEANALGLSRANIIHDVQPGLFSFPGVMRVGLQPGGVVERAGRT